MNTLQFYSYLLFKIRAELQNLDRISKNILDTVEKGEFRNLNELSINRTKCLERYKEFLKDSVIQLSVVDFIALVDKISEFRIVDSAMIDQIAYFYQYRMDAISVSDRDLLVAKFGYSLKSAKV